MAKTDNRKPGPGRKIADKRAPTRLMRANPHSLWRQSSRFVRLAIPIFVVVLALVLLGIFWFYRSYEDPGNVFWGMVGDNLKVTGVTKEIKQRSASGNSDDIMQLSFSPEPKLHSVRLIDSPEQQIKLTIESYNTPKDSYQRYVKIERPVAAGKSRPDYGRIYDLWLKNPTDNSTSSLFGNAVFGVVLVGNVPDATRGEVLDSLHKAYQVDAKTAQLSAKGRRTYTYDVVINLRQYAQAAHDYAKALNLPAAANIKSSDYKDSDKLQVTMSVDAASRHLTQVVYKSNSLTETYSGYGVVRPFVAPTHIVTPAQFEKVFRSVLGA